MYYTPLGGSPIIDELVHTHNCASPVTFSIVIQTPVGGSYTKIVKGCTYVDCSPLTLSQDLHTYIGVHQ